MAGPGGQEVGRVSIRVVPDTSRFASDLRADLRRLEHELKIDIPVSLDTSGIAEHAKAATAEANAAAGKVEIKTEVDSRALAKTSRDLTGFANGIRTSIGSILRGATFAGIGLSAAGAVPSIITLAGSLSQLGGVTALLPALLAGGVTAFGALALGLHGVADALKSGTTPAAMKKTAEALAGLAPSARAAVLAIKGLSPEFTKLRKSVQQALFANLASDIKSLGGVYIPIMARGLRQAADATNIMTRQFARFFKTRNAQVDTATIFKRVGDSLAIATDAVRPLLRAFQDLAVVGGSFLPGLSRGFADLAVKFSAFISNARDSGALTSFIQGGLDAVRQVLAVLGAAGRIVVGIFKAAQSAGGSTLAAFGTVLGRIADVVNSRTFQQGLTTVFAGLQAGAGALAGALPDLGAALASLAPAIAALARGLGATLAAAIRALAPVIIALAPPLTALLEALGPKLVAGINAAAPVLARFAQQLAANKPLLAAVAIAIAALVGPVAGVVVALAILVANFGTVRTFFQTSVLPVFQQLVTSLQPTIQAFSGLGASILAMFTTVRPIFAALFAVVQQNFPAIRQIVVGAFQAIQAIVVAVMTNLRAQIQVTTLIISVIWKAFGGVITATVQRVFPAILAVIRGVLSVITGVFRAFSALLNGNWSGLWAALKQIVSGALSAIVGLVRAQLGLLRGIAEAAVHASVSVFNGFGHAVRSAIGDLAGMFVSVGGDIIRGITNGVKGAAGQLASSVRDAAQGALNSVKSHLGIGSPSKVFRDEVGKWMSLGMAEGVDAHSGAVSKSIIGAVNPPDLGGQGLGSVGRGSAGGTHIENVYAFTPKSLTDQLEEQASRREALHPVFAGA